MKKTFKRLFVAFAIIFSFLAIDAKVISPIKIAEAESSYKVTFELNGGTYSNISGLFSINTNADGKLVGVEVLGKQLTEMPVPTNGNYVFEGWFDGAGLLIDIDHTFTQNTTLYARWSIKKYSYTVSMISSGSSNAYKVDGFSVNDTIYTLSSNCTSLSDAVTLINQDSLESQTDVYVYFDNIEMIQDETVLLSQTKIILSGSVVSEFENPIFLISPELSNSTYYFKNLTLENNNYHVLVSSINSNINSYVYIDDCNFLSTADNSLAFEFISKNYTVILNETTAGKIINHTTSYLFHYFSNMSISANSLLSNSTTNPIKILLDYSEFSNNVLIQNYRPANDNKIIFVPSSDNFSINQYSTETSLKADIFLEFDFNLNGGAFIDGFTPNEIDILNDYALPTKTDAVKEFYNFAGWIGKLEIAGNVYYFDTQMLNEFLHAPDDLSKLSTTPANCDTNYAFDSYSHLSSDAYTFFQLSVYEDSKPAFFAVWDKNEYTITYNSNGGSEVDTITKAFGESITEPIPEKYGYTFLGWFELGASNRYEFSTMPTRNLSLEAKWQNASFKTTFFSEGVKVFETTTLFESSIEKPTDIPEKVGHEISGWFTDADFQTPFNFVTTGQDQTVYIAWKPKTFKVTYVLNPNNSYSGLDSTYIVNIFEYNSIVEKPSDPTTTGYTFEKWITSSTNLNSDAIFGFAITEHKTFYAKWNIVSNYVTFYYETEPLSQYIRVIYDYGSVIAQPPAPNKDGYTFKGWFTDTLCSDENKYIFDDNSKMPATAVNLYAKWEKLIDIILNIQKQTFTDGENYNFDLNTSLGNFVVEYKIDGNWTTALPTQVGIYDVRVSRIADEQYAEFSKVFEKVYEIVPKEINLDWLIIVLGAVFVLQIVALIFIKYVQKTKKAPVVNYAFALPFGIISDKQAIILAVLAGLVIFNFILIIYELVKLHRIQTSELNKPSIYNPRQTIERMGDRSQDVKIARRVDELLSNEDFLEHNNKEDEI